MCTLRTRVVDGSGVRRLVEINRIAAEFDWPTIQQAVYEGRISPDTQWRDIPHDLRSTYSSPASRGGLMSVLVAIMSDLDVAWLDPEDPIPFGLVVPGSHGGTAPGGHYIDLEETDGSV